MKLTHLLIAILITLWTGCENTKKEEKATAMVTSALYGTLKDGREVHEFTLTNKSGASASIINYGGIITSIKVPDKDGNLGEMVLGFDSLAGYLKKGNFGSIVGRFGNRIAGASFTLDGTTYPLEQNDGKNSLHSGTDSFDKVVWEAEEIETDRGPGVKLHYLSPHLDDGFPGNLDTYVTYVWTEDNAIEITYEATTDKKTVVNFTNHSYFNLADHGADILDHELMINASAFLPVDEAKIPLGELKPVSGTPFDFTQPKAIGQDIGEENDQLKIGSGYDHCWVVNNWDGTLKKAATLYAPSSGRLMELFTTEPGVQIYSANHLRGPGRNGVNYIGRGAVCLETQHFPDSPNQPQFPTTILNPGEQFSSTTIYQFSVK